jgi:hypothetical protein
MREKLAIAGADGYIASNQLRELRRNQMSKFIHEYLPEERE